MDRTYYTFRLLSLHPLKVECSKWEDGSIEPSASYIVYPSTDSCSCVSMKRECKHVLRAREITKPNLIEFMHIWRWDERNSWRQMYDIPDLGEFERAVFVSI
jgi:hypothetical protein